MNVTEAANRLLKLIEQTDQQEYDEPMAVQHISQAISEIADETELSQFNSFGSFTLEVDNYSDGSDWGIVPGRVPLTDVVGVGMHAFAYLKEAWLDLDGSAMEFEEKDIRYLLAKYGDTEGTPTRFAVESNFFYIRPVPVAASSYTIRTFFAGLPPAEQGPGATPTMLQQAPFAIIYRAASIASVFTMDDDRAKGFDALAQRLIDRYTIRASMRGDARIEMEDFDG